LESGPYHDVKLAVVIWRDAYLQTELIEIEEAKKRGKQGLTIVSTGFLLDEDEESILISKDWVASLDLIRNFSRIRRCDIVHMYVADMFFSDMGEHAIFDTPAGLLDFSHELGYACYGVVTRHEDSLVTAGTSS
jgi:hypothetical protein